MKLRLILMALACLVFLAGCNESGEKKAEVSEASKAIFTVEKGWAAVKGSSFKKETGAYLLSSKNKKAVSRGKTGSTYVKVPKDIEEKVSGKKIKVVVVAKSAAAPVEFAMAYSTAMNGNSGWKKFKSTNEYKSYSFEYAVPKMTKEANFDYIGVWGDTTGNGGGVLVKSVSIELL